MHRIAWLFVALAFTVNAAFGQETADPRRVVTGHSPDGRSIFVDDAAPARVIRFDSAPGYELTQLWATGAGRTADAADEDPETTEWSVLPGSGETRFLLVRVPSAAEVNSGEGGFDPAAFLGEFAAKVPDLAASMDDPATGMHVTDTIDYLVVISGQVVLALDDGSQVDLNPGDVVIQNGTRHTWINTGDEAALLAAVLVGNEP